MSTDEFQSVRADRDPISQARRATDLLAVYGQRTTELARLRKVAIDQAHSDGMSYTEIASKIGVTKGRITQVRKSAPPEERAFFGVGPVTVAVPLRDLGDRPLGVIAREDAHAAEQLQGLLDSLHLASTQFQIPVDGRWEPAVDAVAICGPKSSSVTAEAIESDPYLSFEPDGQGRWVIVDRATGEQLVSPMDEGDANRDIAYVGRLRRGENMVLVVAGVHALGSIGAVHHLRQNLASLYDEVQDRPFSMVVEGTFDDIDVTETTATWGPKAHT